MERDQMRRVVFEHRPRLGAIYKKEGARSIADYARRVYVNKKPTDSVVVDAVVKATESILGTDIARKARVSLEKNNYVSTVDHHGPVCRPAFFQPDLLRTVLDSETGIPATIVLSCASVTLDNHSFPRGFTYHDESGEELRLPIFGSRYRRACVYGKDGFTRRDAETFLARFSNDEELTKILAPIFLDEKLYVFQSYRSQITALNYRLMNVAGRDLNGSDFISLAIEDVVREILLAHHLERNTPFTRILFEEKARRIFLEETNGIQTAHDFGKEHTTVMFWGLVDGMRVPLRIAEGVLIDEHKNIRVPLERQSLKTALVKETIFPNLALCLKILSYHGLALGGGFSQVDYLPRLVAQTKKSFSLLGEEKSLWGMTDYMGGDFLYVPRRHSSDVSLIDMLKHPISKGDFENALRQTTVAQAIESIIPQVYEIIMAKQETKKTCPYCGNNPTSHMLSRIHSFFSLVLNPLSQKILETWVGRALFPLADAVLSSFCEVLVLFGVVKYNPDPKSAYTERGRVLFDEALARGWKMETAMIFGQARDIYRVTFPNGRRIFFNGLPRPDVDESASVGWIDDKAILKQRLSQAGVPVSKGGSFRNFDRASQCFDLLEKPVIVKPRFGSRGRHTTTNITSRKDLERAFFIAKQLSSFVIMEEHLVGSVYRATIIDGELVGVLAGDPPRITGDGTKTIRELIGLKNRKRDKRVSEIALSATLVSFLERQQYAPEDILEDGKTIDLSEKIGIAYGGKSREVTPLIHTKLRVELERAGRVIDDPVLGFDFITPDVALDPGTVRWGIIECNSVPFINLHHDPLEGTPINVAGKLWDYAAKKYGI